MSLPYPWIAFQLFPEDKSATVLVISYLLPGKKMELLNPGVQGRIREEISV